MSEANLSVCVRDVEGAVVRLLGTVERRGGRIRSLGIVDGGPGLLDAHLSIVGPRGRVERIEAALAALVDVRYVRNGTTTALNARSA